MTFDNDMDNMEKAMQKAEDVGEAVANAVEEAVKPTNVARLPTIGTATPSDDPLYIQAMNNADSRPIENPLLVDILEATVSFCTVTRSRFKDVKSELEIEIADLKTTFETDLKARQEKLEEANLTIKMFDAALAVKAAGKPKRKSRKMVKVTSPQPKSPSQSDEAQ